MYILLLLLKVSDILHFFPINAASKQVSFIWSSERSGYRHLYVSTVALGGDGPEPISRSQVTCTSGSWEVDSKQVCVASNFLLPA